ncbi:MAG: molybdopterin molybdotransferase MoeA [Nitrospinae bacterium]|nr:molybdopterin molybdotransferase MoeA [Nitrospinota bacterium]
MIPVEEAVRIIQDAVRPTERTETVPLLESRGRVLAADAVSDVEIPPFRRVTMDGYAVIAADGAGAFEVVEDVPAGVFPRVRLTPGKVAKVMTGAPLPEGADAVVPVEDTGGYVRVGQKADIKKPVGTGKNFAAQGEDVKMGDTVLAAGTFIRPPEMALLASVGCDPVPVYRLPRVAMLATGDELVDPTQKPGLGQIRNTNTYAILGQLQALGIKPDLLGVGRDNDHSLTEKLAQGAAYDFLIVTGGVSEGDRDLVPAALEAQGYRLLVHKVRVKPGKPLVFGASDDGRFVFGLPGNPVSSMVAFELFAGPALRRYCRVPGRLVNMVDVVVGFDFSRKNAGRQEYLPVNVTTSNGEYLARGVGYHGSGHFAALTRANGLIMLPVDRKEVKSGTMTLARLFEW